MRLIIDADVQPGTIERLRALSPDLEVVDRTGDPTFDVADARRPGRRGPHRRATPRTTSARVPSLRWLQVPVGRGGPHRPPTRRGGRACSSPTPRGLRGPDRRVRQRHGPARPPAGGVLERRPGRPSLAGAASRPLIDPIRGKTAVIAGVRLDRPRGGAPAGGARDADRGDQAPPGRPRRHVVPGPGTGDPDGSIPERIVGDDGLLDAAPRGRRPGPDHAADRRVARA